MSTQPTGREGVDGELFRLLVENVQNHAVFALDAEGRVLTWSPAAEHLLGYREQEVVGQSADRFYTPEDIDRGVPRQELRRALEAGRVEDDRWYVRKDGSRFWSSGVTTPLRGGDGSLRGFATVMRDRTEVKRAEEARTDALAYAQGIVETVREPLVVLDGHLRVRTANRSFYQSFGVSPEETEDRLLYDLGNRQWDIPRLRILLEEVLPQNTSFHDLEVEHDFLAIGRKVMLLNARTLRREGDHSELILLAIEDITERRRAEEERREIETRFTSLVKNIKDHSIFTLDTEGRITSWNAAAERILGYPEAEALGRHFAVIFTPEDRQQGVPEWELRTAREQGRAEDEHWHLRKGGEQFWALGIVSPLHDAGGRLIGFSKILRDMTERRRAEAALRESELRLRAALGAARMGTWHWDIAADRQSLDENLQRLLGLPPEPTVYRLEEFLQMIHPEDREAVAGAFRCSVEQGASLNVEFRVVWPDGSVRWLKDQGDVVNGPNGRPLFLTGACVDITERRAMEDELRRARDELERRVEERTTELRQSQRRALQTERLASIGQTVTTLAHEGRNALQRADACLARLAMRQEGRPEELDLNQRARQALEDLEHLFDDIRNYAAPIQLDLRACDLRLLWREVWAQVLGQRPGRDARLEEQPDGPDLACEADPFRLRQVFSNLFTNALEACPDPLRVVIACREVSLGDRPALQISVQDNGPGFSPEQRQRALEPFFTTKAKGTGLGLAIARRILEAHDGGIAIEEGGGGAKITLTLPGSQGEVAGR